jgi:hypothetical protein
MPQQVQCTCQSFWQSVNYACVQHQTINSCLLERQVVTYASVTETFCTTPDFWPIMRHTYKPYVGPTEGSSQDASTGPNLHRRVPPTAPLPATVPGSLHHQTLEVEPVAQSEGLTAKHAHCTKLLSSL